MKYIFKDDNNVEIHPMDFVVPIILEKRRGLLQTIGTGFFITRYGLVITTKHVIEGLRSKYDDNLSNSFLCQLSDNKGLYLRKIISASFFEDIDIGIIQAENYHEKFPNNPLINKRVKLSGIIPFKNEEVITYAYPENKEMDFNNDVKIIHGDFFKGKFIRFVKESENPSLPFPYFETTIKLSQGASGGPVFHKNNVIGVNCRGWNFGPNTPDDENLSYIVPVTLFINLKFKLLNLPEVAWEYKQLNKQQRKNEVSIRTLIDAGHISYTT